MIRFEKRQIVRKRTDQLLYLELGADNGGIILNLSEEGCNFQAIGPVMEKELNFEFAVGGGQRVYGKGQISWLDATRKLGGLRFNGLSAEHREQIRAWLVESKAVDDGGDGFTLAVAAAPVDSLAKLRRKQLREEARLQWESAKETGAAGSPERVDSAAGANRNHDETVKAPPTSLQGVVEEVFAHEEKKRAVIQASQPATEVSPEKLQSLRSEILGLGQQTPDVVSREPFLAAAQDQTAGRKPTGVSRGIAAIVAGALLAAGMVIYHREIGQSLIWLGAAITGDKPDARGATPNNAEGVPGPAKSAVQEIATPSDPNQVGTDPGATNVRTQQQATRSTSPGALGATGRIGPALRGREVKNGANAASDDVQALWALVESGDTHAEVRLADHYARGDGVVKSCGQAKVLLSAAAKRGDLEAKRKLYELEQAGCP